MSLAKLDTIVVLMQSSSVDDGLQDRSDVYADAFSLWAGRHDVSDAERIAAGAVQAVVNTRFQVQWSRRNAAIKPSDILRVDSTAGAQHYEITGIKMVGFRNRIELTTHTRAAP